MVLTGIHVVVVAKSCSGNYCYYYLLEELEEAYKKTQEQI